MKMKNFKFYFTVFIASLVLVFTSCSSDSIEPIDNQTTDSSNIEVKKLLEIESSDRTDPDEATSRVAAPSYGVVPVHRFFKNGDHLYTKNYNEGVAASYQYEGLLGYARGYSGNPYSAITRWYNRATGERMITADASSEAFASSDVYNRYWDFNTNGYQFYPSNQTTIYGTKGILTSSTSSNGNWVYEGIIGLSNNNGPSGPIYRYYNPVQKDRLFTNDWNELGNGSGNYYYEFVAFSLNPFPY